MSAPSESFLCPITHELMKNPVIDPDGHSYERQAIEDWLQRNGTLPITRAPLSRKDLRANRALKQTIDEYRRSLEPDTQTKGPSSTAMDEETSSELMVVGNYANGFVHVSILPPPDAKRSPCDICCVVDTSRSMAVQAEIQNDTNEKFGLSQLDLVKHALKTIIHSLQPQDRLALVSFANNATVLFELTKMDADGQSSALAALERLGDSGDTNLWDGLRAGLEVLAKGQRAVGSNAALFLLTDGCPNVKPPLGHLATLQKLKTETKFTCTINTFGFGYHLDSNLLEDIAILGNSGTYAFIPDGSFVGTIFVNAITTTLTTVATNVEVVVHGQKIAPSDYTRWYTTNIQGEDTIFELGAVIYGQNKDLLIPLPLQAVSECEFSLRYDTLQEKRKSIQFRVDPHSTPQVFQSVEQQQFRLRLIHCVRTLSHAQGQNQKNSSTDTQLVNAAARQLKELKKEMEHYLTADDPYVKDLLADLNGQVKEAISREEWFKKWGVHFLPSLTRAHLLQYCNNFKDPGVQNYGRGALFSEVRDEMDSIFCGLPAPKPSKQTNAPINMSVFHNSGGGCLHGQCTARLLNGTTVQVKNIKPGDQLAPHGGVVQYVVKTKCRENKAQMVVLDNGLIITAWHPIRLNEQWLMPCSLVSAPTALSCAEVYNFALDRGHTMIVNNVECVTLGHRLQDDVVRHRYYGTDRVIEDLRRLDSEQMKSGIVEITEDDLRRNERTGRVSGVRNLHVTHHPEALVQ